MVKTVPHLQKLDPSSLSDPCLDYTDQEKIDPHQLLMLFVCLLDYGMDLGRIVRYCNNKCVGKHCDLEKAHRDLSPHIYKDGMDQIDRILFQGCPAQLQYELPCPLQAQTPHVAQR